MSFSVATWNINSVRLRIGLVERLLKEAQPDILCLQETKCPQGQFPAGPLKALGYEYIAEFGQKGYHGVAIVSRMPFHTQHSRDFCKKGDSRHVSVSFDGEVPFALHNLYVPAGGDEPDREVNEKFGHKLDFLAEMEEWSKVDAAPKGFAGMVVGDLNIAPLEHDVWSHRELVKVVSHTPIEVEKFTQIQKAGNWVDVMRNHVPVSKKLYTWWSYRAKDWDLADKGRRLDHIWATPELAERCTGIEVLRGVRSWTQPSDHVPVIAKFNSKI
jgi:exodeoxyribonuclease III